LQETLAGGSASQGANTGGTNAAQVGLGVRLGSIDPVMSAGSLQPTGNPTDVAIQGDGWLEVGLGDPEPTASVRPSPPPSAGPAGGRRTRPVDDNRLAGTTGRRPGYVWRRPVNPR
jgi:hypothetical protein